MKYKLSEQQVRIGAAELQVQECGGKEQPVMLLLHSLSGNAGIFAGLLDAGLANKFRCIIPELRGRGLTPPTADGYGLDQQADDLAAVLDALDVDEAVVCGHSFGGLLGVHFAVRYPGRVERLVILDVAHRLNPLTPQLLTLPLARFGRVFPGLDAYAAFFRSAPFVDRWDPRMTEFLRRDVEELADGWLRPRSSAFSVAQASAAVTAVTPMEWRASFRHLSRPLLLLQAEDPFCFGLYLLEEGPMYETLALADSAQHARVPGNHLTMLFGPGAAAIVAALKAFSLAPEVQRRRLFGIF